MRPALTACMSQYVCTLWDIVPESLLPPGTTTILLRKMVGTGLHYFLMKTLSKIWSPLLMTVKGKESVLNMLSSKMTRQAWPPSAWRILTAHLRRKLCRDHRLRLHPIPKSRFDAAGHACWRRLRKRIFVCSGNFL